jgi:parvulin-like peptidyl-prolyl isomerase
MTPSRVLTLLLALVLGLAAAGCGGDGGGDGDAAKPDVAVPVNAIAVVDGQAIPKAEFDTTLKQVQASYEQQDREFPKAGTPEYQALKENVVRYLVERVAFRNAAGELGVEVTEADIDKRLEEVKKQYFEGDEKKFEEALEGQGLTPAAYRESLSDEILSTKLFEAVTKDVTVSDEDVEAYYEEHQDEFKQPKTRDVRHILFSCEKPKACQKAKADAQRIRAEIVGGGDFAALAKQNSDDPGSKPKGGRYDDVAQGSFVAPFDKFMFSADAGELSQPIKTQFGYHLIEPIGEVTPEKVTPLAEVKDSIRDTLLQQKQNEAMTAWVKELRDNYRTDAAFAVGYRLPPEQATETGAGETSTGS